MPKPPKDPNPVQRFVPDNCATIEEENAQLSLLMNAAWFHWVIHAIRRVDANAANAQQGWLATANARDTLNRPI